MGNTYDAYGMLMANWGSVTDASFTSGLYVGYGESAGYEVGESDGGLVKCGARYYLPQWGRFVTSDPAGAGDNWYAYCGNDPVGDTDPSGMEEQGKAYDPTIPTCMWQPVPYWNMPLHSWGPSTPFAMVQGGFVLPKDPSGLGDGWERVPHGDPRPPNNGLQGPGGQTRWKNPRFKKGLEHHPAQPRPKDSGLSQEQWDKTDTGQNGWHTTTAKNNGGWSKDPGEYTPGTAVDLQPNDTGSQSDSMDIPEVNPQTARSVGEAGGLTLGAVILYYLLQAAAAAE